ncbi:MAG: HAD family hydrolase [Clostridia bacterium]|nr:HAD family hydrolase [Clostridia bacterium]
MYRFYIFDLDGTILDTLDDLADSLNYALAFCGVPQRTRAETQAFVGNGYRKLIERALGDRSGDTALLERVLQTFTDYYAAHSKIKTKPYDGIVELLQTLNGRGAVCAVVSNKFDGAVKTLVPYYFGELFSAAFGSDEAAGLKRKPAPDTVLAVMRSLGATAKETVYIGDSDVDIQTAQNAGLPCVAVTWGFRDKAFLKEKGATVLVDEPWQIAEL